MSTVAIASANTRFSTINFAKNTILKYLKSLPTSTSSNYTKKNKNKLMSIEALTLDQQIYEIRSEFMDESEAFKANRSAVERLQALTHINALLDAYNVIKLELCDGRGTE